MCFGLCLCERKRKMGEFWEEKAEQSRDRMKNRTKQSSVFFRTGEGGMEIFGCCHVGMRSHM